MSALAGESIKVFWKKYIFCTIKIITLIKNNMTQNLLINNWWISSQLIIDAAKQRWLETEIISKNDNLFSVSKKGKNIIFKSIDCGLNSSLWLKIANNKELTYRIAEKNNIRVPRSKYINREELDSVNLGSLDIQYPVITKPIDGGRGDGVALNLHNSKELKKWLDYSFQDPHVTRVVIQEQIQWEDHRIIVLNGKVIAVSKRIPPYIVWDGESTVIKLIERENWNSKRWNWTNYDSMMSKIKIDTEAIEYIKEQWYGLEDILPENKKIYVRQNANLSSWGLAIDMTSVIHEEIQAEAAKIATLCWLNFCWVDYFCEDISLGIEQWKGAIIELNATPGIRMHHFPSIGEGRDVAGKILEAVFG
jgi:cyanophycin synthetase